jgi:hypothetical protein
MRMDMEQRPIIFQISMPCSTVATALKLASPMEIDENKRSIVARCRGNYGEDGVPWILGYNLLSGRLWGAWGWPSDGL